MSTPVCSAKGCQESAVWALVWNNPKLHTADRRKSWLACDGHREQLASFLGARQFLREVVPVAEAPDDPGPS
ncbi:acetone carboxylase [Nocardioides agariphilus]|uniref:acetone carboxylase n=1 Tax=Nocardioides agariphilus TaxID=433664 RepID=UPI00351F8DFE